MHLHYCALVYSIYTLLFRLQRRRINNDVIDFCSHELYIVVAAAGIAAAAATPALADDDGSGNDVIALTIYITKKPSAQGRSCVAPEHGLFSLSPSLSLSLAHMHTQATGNGQTAKPIATPTEADCSFGALLLRLDIVAYNCKDKFSRVTDAALLTTFRKH